MKRTAYELSSRRWFESRAAVCLAPLAAELRGLNDWPQAEVNAALLLRDVLVALNLPEDLQRWLLGERGWHFATTLIHFPRRPT
jgi:hypothetical protein